jgi:hypothetical protein
LTSEFVPGAAHPSEPSVASQTPPEGVESMEPSAVTLSSSKQGCGVDWQVSRTHVPGDAH